MVRSIDTSSPLSEDDIAYLRARQPEEQVQHLIALSNSEQPEQVEFDLDELDEDEDGEDTEEADESSEEGDGGADPSETPEDAESADEDDEEDLIGGDPEPVPDGELYDPLVNTTTEARRYMKTASPTEVERVKAVELARTDREPRTSITNYTVS